QTVRIPEGTALLLLNDGVTSRTLAVGAQALRLGRATDNEIVIGQPFVSSHHARIEPEGAAHVIVDLNSTNGLLVAGRRVTRHQLRDGDTVRIGDSSLGILVTMVYLNPQVPAAPPETSQHFALTPGQKQFTLGRVGCDIVLDNPSISRFHAQLDLLPDGHFLLRDTGSSNGTFVNGQRITQHRLVVGDNIQVGPFKLTFTGTELERSDQRSALRISAHNLAYIVGGQKATKQLLYDVSLVIEPREFVALVGGSGAGKSTLLKALAGVNAPSGGGVRFNGEDLYGHYDSYRTLIGYVPQDDTIHRTLPVNRALAYIGRLRLPTDTSASEIGQRADQALDLMELGEHRLKRVENLSGGQRKRVCIAAELIAEPGVCFLDEASSGLDPGLEKRLMFTLRRLADAGKTVVLVTHATENIAQCDLVAFMSRGRLVFFGPPAEALSFFNINSDNFADIYLKLEGQADPQSQLIQNDLRAEYAAWRTTNPQAAEPPRLAELWEQHFRQSAAYQTYVVARLAQVPAAAQPTAAPTKGRKTRFSPWRQMQTLTRRYLDVILQDRRYLLLLLLQAPLIAMLVALVTPRDALTGVLAEGLIQRNEARKLLFMLMTAGLWFGVSNAALEIVKERTIIGREWLANLRVGAYLTSKFATLALLALVQTIALLLIVAAKVDLSLTDAPLLPAVFGLFITLTLTTLAATALGLAMSALSRTAEQSASAIPLLIIPQLLFAGLLFKIDQPLTQILSWFMISRWSMDALGTSVRLMGTCDLPNIIAGRPACLETATTDSFLPAALSLGEQRWFIAFTPTAEHLWVLWAILVGFSAAGIAATVWQLRQRQHTRK
ncbi:MAG: FHA domain-containing protein, partial [Chloroflexales bacterium]